MDPVRSLNGAIRDDYATSELLVRQFSSSEIAQFCATVRTINVGSELGHLAFDRRRVIYRHRRDTALFDSRCARIIVGQSKIMNDSVFATLKIDQNRMLDAGSLPHPETVQQ